MSSDHQNTHYKKILMQQYYLDQTKNIVDEALTLKHDGLLSDFDLECLGFVLDLKFNKPFKQWETVPLQFFEKFKSCRGISV